MKPEFRSPHRAMCTFLCRDAGGEARSSLGREQSPGTGPGFRGPRVKAGGSGGGRAELGSSWRVPREGLEHREPSQRTKVGMALGLRGRVIGNSK